MIENWRAAWKFISVQAMALALAIQTIWPMIPDDMKASLPPQVVHAVTIALLVAGIAGRLYRQGGLDADVAREGSGDPSSSGDNKTRGEIHGGSS
jgi:hypothetical protein